MFEKGTGGPLCMFSFPTTSPKYREINLQETKKKILKSKLNWHQEIRLKINFHL